jgi:CBS domain-containing protein
MSTSDAIVPAEPMTVGHLMTAEPVVIPVDAPLEDAVSAMAANRVSGLPVVDDSGRVVGVISETDLVRARASEWLWEHWNGLKVRHFMTTPPITISRSATLGSAVAKMEEERIHRIVVVAEDDPGRAIGVLSTSDVIRSLAEGDR